MILSPGVFLAFAIALEVFATLSLKASDGFRLWTHALLAVSAYIASFYCLSLALRAIPIGVAYAIWSGVGIVLLMAIHTLETRRIDTFGVVGALLILAGILCINMFSEAA